MAKDKLTEYSATNASNDVIGDISVAEGMLPSAVNNALREQMTHLKNFSDGTDAIDALAVDNLKLDGNTISSTDTNGDITIDPNGSGQINLSANVDVTGTVTADGLTVDTNTLHVDATNNRVGIGTTTPNKELSVVGNVELYNDDVDGYIWFHDYGTTSYAIGRDQSSDTFSINRYSDLTTNPLVTVTSGGTALIGSTAARATGSKLELTNPANTATVLYMFKNTQVESTIGFKASTDTNFYIGTGSTNVGTNGVYLTNAGNSWNSVSDETQKTIVENIENASEKVSTLRTVMGYYNNDENETRRPFLIAQDVQAVLPEAVSVQDIETGVLGMSYTDVIPLLTAAIKEQRETINALEARLTALEAE